MIYEYKKLGIKIIADSKKEAIENIKKAINSKITAMSFNRDKIEAKIDSQTPNIVIWWCLCWYLSNVENKNGLLHHEKIKLKGLLRKLSELSFSGNNTKKVKFKLIKGLWIDGYDYDKKPGAVISEFIDKFDSEGIEEDEEMNQKIAKEFGKELPTLINLVCQEDYSKIADYINNKFHE